MKKQKNIIKKLWDKVTIEKWYKAIRVFIICMAFMVLSEGLFEIPEVKEFFGASLIEGKSGWLVYVIVWLVMYAQVAIIPIPALPIITACNQIPNLVGSNSSIGGLFSLQTLLFLILIVSATTLGAMTSYWIGRKFGKPAIRWIAGSDADYKTWSKKLNGKVGRWVYAATVLLPIFPDDLISLVVGSIKMNFTFYTVSNLICKTIGLFSMLLFMRIPGVNIFFGTEGDGFPIALTIYAVLFITAIIVQACLNKTINKNQPKKIKMGVIKEKILYIINKKKSASKDLIIDYKLDKTFKTYLASKVTIHKLYDVDKFNNKVRVRILIECKASDYNQIIFNKSYKLTDNYNCLIRDIKQLNI